MRRIWIAAVFLSGCSLFDTLDVVYESNVDLGHVSDLSDASALSDVDVADVSDDLSQMDADIGDVGMDSADDAAPDMPQNICAPAFPYTNIPSGGVCDPIPPITKPPACDVVEQNGCPEGQYCTVVYTGMGLVARCTSIIEGCIGRSESCTVREDAIVRTLGACYPGGFCPPLKSNQDSTSCTGYCRLESGYGCKPDQFCVSIAAEISDMGLGYCSAPTAACF